jgi:superfamily I DNA/RNA helicase
VASKIAYLIEQGAKTENILALAFNQKAAEDLKNRVISMVGNAEDLSINLSLFLQPGHSGQHSKHQT